jgi:hypothetical protein
LQAARPTARNPAAHHRDVLEPSSCNDIPAPWVLISLHCPPQISRSCAGSDRELYNP